MALVFRHKASRGRGIWDLEVSILYPFIRHYRIAIELAAQAVVWNSGSQVSSTCAMRTVAVQFVAIYASDFFTISGLSKPPFSTAVFPIPWQYSGVP